jgi:hypothetical protein
MGTAVIFPDLLAIEKVICIEIFDLAGKPSLKLGRIETGDRSGTTLPVDQAVPVFRNRIPDRGQCAKTSYYNSS